MSQGVTRARAIPRERGVERSAGDCVTSRGGVPERPVTTPKSIRNFPETVFRSLKAETEPNFKVEIQREVPIFGINSLIQGGAYRRKVKKHIHLVRVKTILPWMITYSITINLIFCVCVLLFFFTVGGCA